MNKFPIFFFTLIAALFSVTAANAQVRGEYLITNYGARGDGVFDNGPIINDLVNRLGPAGGSIVIPHGDFRINQAIIIRKNFVTIRGLGPGSKLIVGAGVREGIVGPVEPNRLSGLTVRDLHVAGGDFGANQAGILIDRANDGILITNVTLSNLRRGIFLRNADAARVIGNRVVDSEASFHMVGGFMTIVNRNHFSGYSGGVTVLLEGLDRVQFTGNVIMPDGAVGLHLANAHNCNISGNTITAWYTGAIEVRGNMNSISGNNISAVQVNGQWLPDPRGRDGLWGLIRIEGNDNTLTGNQIMSWQPDGHVRVNVVSGHRNVLRDLYIAAIGSNRKINVHNDAHWTRITHSGISSEISNHGQNTRIAFDP
jgi:parallel beta-helix repeat protein